MNVPILPIEGQQTADLERFNGHIFRLKTALSYRTVSITLTGGIRYSISQSESEARQWID